MNDQIAVPDDARLLTDSLNRLTQNGSLEYSGEFGAEITTFIPYVGWLKQQGLLSGRRIISYEGMRPYYFFLDDAEFAEKSELRRWQPLHLRGWPSNSTYTATRQRWHAPPDYRAHYRDRGRRFERPVLFIQNKFTVEWNVGPLNYLPLGVLDRLFRLAGDRFDVVYSRPRPLRSSAGYSLDENALCNYPDFTLARQYPKVLALEDFCENSGADYNRSKLEMLAKSWLFVTVQGGGAHLLACFDRAVILLLHRRGEEYPHAYQHGPYRYLANPAPTLLLAQDDAQLDQGIALLEAVRVEGADIRVSADYRATLDALRVVP